MRADVCVVGGGLAGLYAVLHLPAEWNVVVVDKGPGSRTGSSPLAQGGMAVPVHPEDSPARHAADTLRAGAGSCVAAAVELLTAHARQELDRLIELGCDFDRETQGRLDLNREGGQSVARSVHWADATGREIMRAVVEQASRRAERLVGTAVRIVVDDGHCVGVAVNTGESLTVVSARAVLLAAGGCGGLYDATTNVAAATGDAVALAWEAGADVADLEFVQFHPTALAAGGLQRVLLTEALRGEGAIVVDADGRRFLHEHHPDGELAPRDVVARAVASRGGAFLDATRLGPHVLRARFPNVYDAALQAGFDLAERPAPVSPAAHYMLGGVATDLAARTTVPGLYAAGECAATGVHGANRMAGNSLTEAVVFGRIAAATIIDEVRAASARPLPDVVAGDDDDVAARPGETDHWAGLRSAMTRGAGLVRTRESLREALGFAERILAGSPSSPLRLAATTAALVCRAALVREESRGVHYRADVPDAKPEWDGAHVSLRRCDFSDDPRSS